MSSFCKFKMSSFGLTDGGHTDERRGIGDEREGAGTGACGAVLCGQKVTATGGGRTAWTYGSTGQASGKGLEKAG